MYIYDNINLYNVRERRVHLLRRSRYRFCTERSLYFCERFEVIMYSQVSRCFKTTDSDQSVCLWCWEIWIDKNCQQDSVYWNFKWLFKKNLNSCNKHVSARLVYWTTRLFSSMSCNLLYTPWFVKRCQVFNARHYPYYFVIRI